MSFNNKRITCVIPARMSSGRFPGKPLAKINGRELVLRVVDIAKQSKFIDEVIVATEDEIIADLVEKEGHTAMITSTHYTCTHRVSEVAQNLHADYVFNLQGDEPLTKPVWLDEMIEYGITNEIDVLQSSRALEEGEVEDEDVVKMVVNNNRVTHMQRKCDVVCDNICTQLGLSLIHI